MSPSQNLKFISWNVNGIRAAIKKGFLDYLSSEDPDFICLQETKAQREQVDLELADYHQYWYSAEKKGYSGTLILAKHEPLSVAYGLGIEEHDREGRVICLEYPDYFLITVYTPNSQNELRRLAYRTQEWDVAFLNYMQELEKTKPVIVCGDFNVAHKEIDLKNPKTNTKNAGFTPEERAAFDQYIDAGFIDTFREFCQEPDHYTWWSYRAGARQRNVGWRIDYFLISPSLRPRLLNAFIRPEILGSDHCPVGIELEA